MSSKSLYDPYDHWIRSALADCPEAIPLLSTIWAEGRVFDSESQFGDSAIASLSTLGAKLSHLLSDRSELSPFDLVLVSSIEAADSVSPARVMIRNDLNDAVIDFCQRAITATKTDTLYTQVHRAHLMGPAFYHVSTITRSALFLDRDGTIIELVPYVKDPGLVKLKHGITDLIRWAKNQGMACVCVTNQSGIGREYYTWGEYQAIQDRMQELLAQEGLALDGGYAAGYFPDAVTLVGQFGASLRKPAPGMLTWAANQMNLDLRQSVMVGDSEVDLGAGTRAGCAQVFQIHDQFTLFDVLTKLQAKLKI